MPAHPPRSVYSRGSEQQSWISRVGENFHQLLIPIDLRASSSNGAPLHLVDLNHEHRGGRAQICSTLAHATAIALLLYGAVQQTRDGAIRKPRTPIDEGTILRYVPPLLARPLGRPSLGNKGGSGDESPILATRGNLAPHSPLQLLAPHLPQIERPELPVPVAIFDSQAPTAITSITHLGLPWMRSDTNSGGPGMNHGIGEGPGHGMGGEGWNDEGFGTDGRPYANVVSWPICTYCPDPSYTEEARKGKLQGSVMLRILVTAEGRAAQVRVVKGLSSDLNERAAQTVKGWRFIPAKDLARKGVSVWMTVEVLYRLF